jgi:hypothetical protein
MKDLLNLTRTSKLFRATLASTQAKTIWRIARKGWDVPDPPKDIPEASWANLFLSFRCQASSHLYLS